MNLFRKEDTEIEDKICSVCQETKPVTGYYSIKKNSKSKGEYIYYFPYCKECTKNKSSKWQKSNPDQRRRIWIKYNETDHSKRKRYEDNVRMRSEGKYKKWQKNNPEKLKKYAENRQHKKHDITRSEWDECKKYFNYECAYCGISDDEAKEKFDNYLHKDHVDHEGSNDLSNCVPACKSCNGSKSVHKLDEWYNKSSAIYTEERHNKILKWLDNDYLKYIKITR